ncbi:MAG: methyl-accepting chemotaxis protein [Rhodobacteraceae bacterium]|nr:MAG: methyl-accepting chemotaxis protein [Paracoccaceae bacterium]
MAHDTLDQNSPLIGRFDQSFLIHMIRDFFVILIAVTVLEFTLKAGLVYYDFRVNGPGQVESAAGDLAENVHSIMRNEGGPVAARTVYPIINRNWNDLGYRIAIIPAPVTVTSIEESFGFRPEGVPLGDWPEARHNAAQIDIRAETFCLGCHTGADLGDVLGSVIVRRDLRTDFTKWMEDVRITGMLSLGKIVLHSFLLFLILRARLEPLLGLRAVVSNLARAYGGLTHRADIRTADEFGVLARDLNVFLDRVGRLVEELDSVLNRVVVINDDMMTIQGDLRERIDALTGRIRQMERSVLNSARTDPHLAQVRLDHVQRNMRALQERAGAGLAGSEMAAMAEELQSFLTHAEAQVTSSERVFADLAALGDDSERLKGALGEMVRLEERMKGVAETGSNLVERLRPAGAG